MNTLKAYGSFLFFSAFAAGLAFGWKPPTETSCVGRCPGEDLADVVAMIGPLPAAGILFAAGIASFFIGGDGLRAPAGRTETLPML